MDVAIRVQILNEAIFISHIAHTLRKGIKSTILPLDRSKEGNTRSSLTLIWQPIKERENSEFGPVKQHLEMTLCHILLMQSG